MARTALSLALAASLAAPVGARAVQTVEPRAFGYTVGDLLQRRIQVDPSLEGRIDAASLPRPGRAGRWFALRTVAPDADGAEVVLGYQLVNSPEQPVRENLPSLRVQVIGPDGRSRPADIGPFTVAIAPVAPLEASDTIQPGDLRPDRDPAPIDTGPLRRRVAALAAALLLLILAQCAPYASRRWLGRRAGPFLKASRALRRATRGGGDDALQRQQALRRLHQALDETAGLTVAQDNLDRLFDVRPQLRPARAPIQAMLADSRAAFFGESAAPPVAQLQALARQLADLEARAGR